MSVVKGVISFIFSAFIIKLASFISQIILGFYLSKEAFGLYGIALSLNIFGACFQSTIIQKILIQKASAVYSIKYTIISICFRIISFLLVFFIAIAYSLITEYYVIILVSFFLCAADIINAFIPIFKANLLSNARYDCVAKVEAQTRSAAHLAAIPNAILGLGALSFVIHKPICQIYEYFFLKSACLKFTNFKLKIPKFRDFKSYKLSNIFLEYKWLIAIAFFTTVVVQGDYLILGLLVDIEIIGLYFFGYTFSVQISNLITSSVLSNVLMAEFSSQKDEAKRNVLFLNSLLILFLALGPIFYTFSIFSEKILYFIWGDVWIQSIIVIKLFFIIMPLRLVSAFLRTLFESEGNWRESAYLAGAGALGVSFASLIGGVTNDLFYISASMFTWYLIYGLSLLFIIGQKLEHTEGNKILILSIPLSYSFLFILEFFHLSALLASAFIMVYIVISLTIAYKQGLIKLDVIK